MSSAHALISVLFAVLRLVATSYLCDAGSDQVLGRIKNNIQSIGIIRSHADIYVHFQDFRYECVD